MSSGLRKFFTKAPAVVTFAALVDLLGEDLIKNWDDDREGRLVGKAEFTPAGEQIRNVREDVKYFVISPSDTAAVIAVIIAELIKTTSYTNKDGVVRKATSVRYSGSEANASQGFFLFIVNED